MKKIIALTLLLTYLLAVTQVIYADETAIATGVFGTDITWSIDYNGLLTIEGNGKVDNSEPWSLYEDVINAVKIESGITSIAATAFRGLDSVETIYWNAIDCTIVRGLYENSLLSYYSGNSELNVIFGNGVKKIPADAFRDCPELKSVMISDTVTDIAYGAFSNCTGLTRATIPEGVTTIGNAAFGGCSSLERVTIPDSVTAMGKYVFKSCDKLSDVTLGVGITRITDQFLMNCDSLVEIIIPEGVKSIGFEAFGNCSGLKSIIIPKSVKTIEKNAFYNSKNLEKVYYTGSKEKWNNINIVLPYTNSDLLDAEKIFNYQIPSVYVEIASVTSTENSLRFISDVTIKGEVEISTFGTTFIPLWLFETGSTNVAIVQYDNSKYNIKDGQTFGATLSDVPKVAKDMQIVGKSFVKNMDGQYTWSATKSASVNNTTLIELK